MITGLDKLEPDIEQASNALSALDGELGAVTFDPDDPASIEMAIQEVDRLIDERIGGFLGNPIIGPLAEGMKEKYREAIIEKAAALRLDGSDANDK